MSFNHNIAVIHKLGIPLFTFLLNYIVSIYRQEKLSLRPSKFYHFLIITSYSPSASLSSLQLSDASTYSFNFIKLLLTFEIKL